MSFRGRAKPWRGNLQHRSSNLYDPIDIEHLRYSMLIGILQYLTAKQEIATSLRSSQWHGNLVAGCVVSNRATNWNLYSSNVAERVREVTIPTALGTYCPWGHPHKLKFACGFHLKLRIQSMHIKMLTNQHLCAILRDVDWSTNLHRLC